MNEETIKPNNSTSEFKESAFKLAIESQQPIAETARDLYVYVNTWDTWIGKYSKPKQQAGRIDNQIFGNMNVWVRSNNNV